MHDAGRCAELSVERGHLLFALCLRPGPQRLAALLHGGAPRCLCRLSCFGEPLPRSARREGVERALDGLKRDFLPLVRILAELQREPTVVIGRAPPRPPGTPWPRGIRRRSR